MQCYSAAKDAGIDLECAVPSTMSSLSVTSWPMIWCVRCIEYFRDPLLGEACVSP